MKWLPSFTMLFLLFVAGLGLQMVAVLFAINAQPVSTGWEISSIARLVGLALMIISPILIGLKFFTRLDQKS